MPDPMLPLPPAVLARLDTAETLRAELAGVTAERDALRDELKTAGWERDTAQNEAAYLREDVLGRDRVWAESVRQEIGRILTSGDDSPPPPDEGRPDVALVSLSTGEIRVRTTERAPDSWARYGETSASSDFATLAERGPWITVENYEYRDHHRRGQARRKLRDALWAAKPGLGRYPEGAAGAIESWRANSERWISDLDEADLAARISVLTMVTSAVRHDWEIAQHRADRLTETLATVPHPPDWRTTNDVRRCALCCVVEAIHLTLESAP